MGNFFLHSSGKTFLHYILQTDRMADTEADVDSNTMEFSEQERNRSDERRESMRE